VRSVRVHNESKVAATPVDLEIPDGVTVTEVAKPGGSYATKTTGDRITTITWPIDVQPGKYVALPFTAKTLTARRNCTGACTNTWRMDRPSMGATSRDRRRRARSRNRGVE
jgi:hypothetical protein